MSERRLDEAPLQLGAVAAAVGKGLVAGMAGTAAMTVSSTLEARLRGREPSTTPARAASKVLRVAPVDEQGERRFNNVVHWGYGTGWGPRAAGWLPWDWAASPPLSSTWAQSGPVPATPPAAACLGATVVRRPGRRDDRRGGLVVRTKIFTAPHRPYRPRLPHLVHGGVEGGRSVLR